MSKKLLKSTAIVSVMTLVSRISGLVRDVVMANLIGPGATADAFFVAFRIPNFLRRIFGEGAFSQAFVPVFSELTARNTVEARRFMNVAVGSLGLITLVLSILGIIFAPYIVHLFAPGFVSDADKFATTVDALRWMFPYLFCISVVAMSGGVLNTLNRFAVPAVTPVLLNLCLIAAMLLLIDTAGNAARALAIGVLIAGFVQLLFQLPALKKAGYFPKPALDHSNPHVKRVFSLMVPAIFSVSVAQINTLINTFLASFLVTGSVSWLYFSDRLMEFPIGVFGIALATVVLPNLSREHVLGSDESFSKLMDWALRWVVVIAVPATLALYLLATPLLATIFQYNAFTQNDVVQSATALRAFSIGVCGFILVKVLAPGYFARQNTKTPMRIAMISVMVNIVMSLVLIQFMAHNGLALAISIAAWVNSSLLFVCLRRAGIYTPQAGWSMFTLKVAIAVVAMSLVLGLINHGDEWWYEQGLARRAQHMMLLVVGGGVAYFAVLLVLGLRPQQLLLRPNESP